jgi:hypothetical protein
MLPTKRHNPIKVIFAVTPVNTRKLLLEFCLDFVACVPLLDPPAYREDTAQTGRRFQPDWGNLAVRDALGVSATRKALSTLEYPTESKALVHLREVCLATQRQSNVSTTMNVYGSLTLRAK